MFTAALLLSITITWKQSKCPLTEEWVKKMWYIHMMEYCSVIKMVEMVLFTETWIDLEVVIQSEIGQIKYHIVLVICGI